MELKAFDRESSIALLVLSLLSITAGFGQAAAQDVQYNRDVRPILSEKCFRCHGPDAATRESGLRLDISANATLDRGGYRVIDAGNPDASDLIRRVESTDLDQRMPPHETGSSLSVAEVETLRTWIERGAAYQSHWSFIPPRRSSLPAVIDEAWPSNAIDRFVLSKLELHGLQPRRTADPATLIRRVTLDLTGLPPSLDEIDAFQRDSIRNPHLAYQTLVDRLLASPRYGARMAVGWLDAARYADTNGYFTDLDRTMWPWRDWVIDALNRNMPFDQFTIEQLAGDLLPNATIDQKIATGFNRNHMVNNETGIIEEEFRVEYVADRVDTTATVWMGMTLRCARCHDHKYDPISQQDFYRFFSLFNNVPEKGLSGSRGNSAPLLQVPSKSLQLRLGELQREVSVAEQQFSTISKQLVAAQTEWEQTITQQFPRDDVGNLVAHYPLDRANHGVSGNVEFVAGMIDGSAEFDGDASIRVEAPIEFERDDTFSVEAWIRPAGPGCVISKIDDANDMRGFDVVLRKGKVVVDLVHTWNRDSIQVSTVSSVVNKRWQHLVVTYDGSNSAAGVRIYLDGNPQPTQIGHDSLSGTTGNREPLRIGRRQASASYRGRIDDVRIYDRTLTDREVRVLATGDFLRSVVAKPVAERTEVEKKRLQELFVEHRGAGELAIAFQTLERLRQQQRQLAASVPTTMVMQEAEKPRQAFVLVRGQYDQPAAKVAAGVPEFFASGSVANRLDLAKWLVDPAHPLTARVTVNRLWQQLLGTGIVKSVDDFGTQGDWPSHGELLDWLAIEFIESGWDIKHLLRLIVTSATYRQSSDCSAELLRRDPENRLLARAPRIRMGAEMLRDNALAISGLLVERAGGPAVMPYQPDGLWEDVTYDSDRGYQVGAGDALYRRSLYTFWKRQSPPPNMLLFDAPTRETCTVHRSRTNTPLQALALMNDPTFLEASRSLAERIMRSADAPSDRLGLAFRLATGRRPAAGESRILLNVYRQQLSLYKQNVSQAVELLGVGESEPDASLDKSELAAWSTVASMILCLDETITKP